VIEHKAQSSVWSLLRVRASAYEFWETQFHPKQLVNLNLKIEGHVRQRWLTPVMLATREAEIRKIEV
jgi:hypothetical protein